MTQSDFGRKVAERRKELGLTQEELAEKCIMNVRSIQRIEAGTVNPRMHTIKVLSEALGFEEGIHVEKESRPWTTVLSNLLLLKEGDDDILAQLKIAWIAGLIYFAIGIPELVFEVIRAESGIEGFNIVSYVIVSIISILAIFYFQRGFIVLGKGLQNQMLTIAAWLIIGVSVLSTLAEIVTLGHDGEGDKIIAGAECITFGFLSIFFGIGIKRLKHLYGNVAKHAGNLEIVVGVTFVILPLFLFGLILSIPALILEIVLLYRASISNDTLVYVGAGEG